MNSYQDSILINFSARDISSVIIWEINVTKRSVDTGRQDNQGSIIPLKEIQRGGWFKNND
jgi:hypothetical protein